MISRNNSVDFREENFDNEVMAATLTVPTHPELKRLVQAEARRLHLPMNELITKLLAAHYERDDLAFVPRKPIGRPPRERNGGQDR
jgi:hypothetical protein